MRRWVVLLVASLLVFTSGWTATAPAADPSDPREAADALLWLVNEERSRWGLPGVRSRDDVVPIATEHSQRMADAGDLFHNDAYFAETNRDRLHARALGENVAYGPNIEAVHDVLMKSDEHRNVILDRRFAVVGIGAVWDGERWWITQDFVEPRS